MRRMSCKRRVSSTKALNSCNQNLEFITRSFVPLLTALSVEDRMEKAVFLNPTESTGSHVGIQAHRNFRMATAV
jgi:hypothetical protein